MKTLVYPSDRHGCGSFRAIWPGEHCAAAGHDVEVVRPQDGDSLRHVGVCDPLEYDHIGVDEDVLDDAAFHHEADAPVLRAHHLDVMSGGGAVLAGPDRPEAAASVTV